jgi:hypothetical protein
MDYGFKEPQIDSTQWTFGAIDGPKLVKGGQWDKYLPVKEIQKKQTESWNCTSFGLLNALEVLMYRLYGGSPNYSDRGLGIFAGTTKGGNDPQTVHEALRKQGAFPEYLLPFASDIKDYTDYYSWRGGVEEMCRELAEEWLDTFEFHHEWVFTRAGDTQADMMDALDYSPLGVSVKAWAVENGLYIKETEGNSNHWTMCYGYVPGRHWKIYDSYDNTNKRLAWDYKFDFCKRISIGDRKTPREKPDELQQLIDRFLELLQALRRRITGQPS